jgi:hypothetical protein
VTNRAYFGTKISTKGTGARPSQITYLCALALGRTGDGEPGVRALWRGYQRLQDMLEGFHLRASLNSG